MKVSHCPAGTDFFLLVRFPRGIPHWSRAPLILTFPLRVSPALVARLLILTFSTFLSVFHANNRACAMAKTEEGPQVLPGRFDDDLLHRVADKVVAAADRDDVPLDRLSRLAWTLASKRYVHNAV